MGHQASLTEHQMEAFHENVDFLRGHGLSDEQIARRLNVNPDTMKKREERRDL